MNTPEGLVIREEGTGDAARIHDVTAMAFRHTPHSDGSEPAVVAGLRRSGALTVSLVAEMAGRVVGHIAFSPAVARDGSAPWFALGPVSVLPRHQRKGVGSALVLRGLELLEQQGARGCMLLGDARYYRRFGFKPAPDHAPDTVPAAHFMLRLSGKAPPEGVLDYHPAFFGAA